MAAWLFAAIDRLPQRARGMVVAVTALLLLAGAVTSLTLEAAPGGAAHRATPIPARPSRPAPARALPLPLSPPVSAVEQHTARVVAARFLRSYLKFAYGRGRAGAVKGVTPGLRSQLIRQRAQATPAERRRHPRVVSLHVIGMTPGFVLATATVDDGGIAAYRLRFALREHDGRWSVSSVQEG